MPSHSVLFKRGCAGGVSPKSPGFLLCAGFPVYPTLSASDCSRASSGDLIIWRFGLYFRFRILKRQRPYIDILRYTGLGVHFLAV